MAAPSRSATCFFSSSVRPVRMARRSATKALGIGGGADQVVVQAHGARLDGVFVKVAAGHQCLVELEQGGLYVEGEIAGVFQNEMGHGGSSPC
jgi:hypothetical protein